MSAKVCDPDCLCAGTLMAQPLLRHRNTVGVLNTPAKFTPLWNSFDDVAPLLEGKNLPSLRTLGIKNCAYTDEVCAAIAKAPILKQLTTLDLGRGTMSDEGRPALIAAKKALSHLSLLDLSENTLESTDGLEGLCAEVRLDDQRPDDGYDGERYVMVGE